MTDYGNIYRPYDNLLSRVESDPSNPTVSSLGVGGVSSVSEVKGSSTGEIGSSGNGSESGGSVATVPVKSDGNIGDLWIKNFIRSQNWKPKTSGFYIDGQTGYAEFSNIYVKGGGNVGGWSLTATEIYSGNVHIQSTAERILFGAATAPNAGIGIFMGKDGSDYEFRVGNPAGANMWWNGTSLTVSGATLDGVVVNDIATGSDLAIQGWQFSGVFSATDYQTLAWTSGTISLMDGQTFAISPGNTGAMAATTYIYFDKNISTTVLQVTTTPATAVGSNKILIGVAQNNAVTTKDCTFQIFGGTGGMGIFVTADNIAANTITANELAANSVTASKISVSDLSSISADIGSVTSGTITGALIRTSSSGARVEIDGTNDQIEVYDSGGEMRMKLDQDELVFYNGSGVEMGVFAGGILGASQMLGVNLTSSIVGRAFVIYDNGTAIAAFSTSGLTMYDHIEMGGVYDINEVDDINFVSSGTATCHLNGGTLYLEGGDIDLGSSSTTTGYMDNVSYIDWDSFSWSSHASAGRIGYHDSGGVQQFRCRVGTYFGSMDLSGV